MHPKLFKFIQRFLKYYVVSNDIVMTLHCALLLGGTNIWLMEYFCGFSVFGFVALMATSFLLGFCWLYRSFLIHDFIVYSCIVFKREIGFGLLLIPLRWVMLVIGILLIIILIKQKYENIYCK